MNKIAEAAKKATEEATKEAIRKTTRAMIETTELEIWEATGLARDNTRIIKNATEEAIEEVIIKVYDEKNYLNYRKEILGFGRLL